MKIRLAEGIANLARVVLLGFNNLLKVKGYFVTVCI
jgi:hypothetical protein